MFQTDSPEEPDDLFLFAPARTACRGANGWSSEVRRAFVVALAHCGRRRCEASAGDGPSDGKT